MTRKSRFRTGRAASRESTGGARAPGGHRSVCAFFDITRPEWGLTDSSRYSFRPSVCACADGHLPTVLYLLSKHNADPLVRNNFGETAYDVSAGVFEVYICEVSLLSCPTNIQRKLTLPFLFAGPGVVRGVSLAIWGCPPRGTVQRPGRAYLCPSPGL